MGWASGRSWSAAPTHLLRVESEGFRVRVRVRVRARARLRVRAIAHNS